MWLTLFLPILIFNSFLPGIIGQQNGSLKSDLNNPMLSVLQNNGLTIPKNLNQIPKSPLKNQRLGNVQQPVNLQQAALQQQLNLQQLGNSQSAKNFQGLNFQQMGMQPNLIQQQNLLRNLQVTNPDISQSPSPVLNSNLPGSINSNLNNPALSTAICNQGLLSNFNPGLQSTISPSVNTFASQPTLEMLSSGFLQNNQIPFSNISPNVNTGSFNQFPTIPDTTVNNQPVLAVVAVPGQDQTSLNVMQTPMADKPIDQITIIKTGQHPSSIDVMKNYSPALNPNQLSLISSIMSESSKFSPPPTIYSSDSLLNTMLSKQGSKSSNLKTLLPLIFNLLKEKNADCGCRHCGCMKNNIQEPQIFSGYANQNIYGLNERISLVNNDKSEDIRNYKKNKKNRKNYEKDNKINIESGEFDQDYNDTYEDYEE